MSTLRTDDNGTWPALPYANWKPTLTTRHLWTQIIGKSSSSWLQISFASTIANGLGSQPNGDVLSATGVAPISFTDFASKTGLAWK